MLSVSQPERNIPFGSAARGAVRSPDDARKKSVVVGDALRGLGFPFDVIVMATQRFEETKDLVGGLALPAASGGRVIYEAA